MKKLKTLQDYLNDVIEKQENSEQLYRIRTR